RFRPQAHFLTGHVKGPPVDIGGGIRTQPGDEFGYLFGVRRPSEAALPAVADPIPAQRPHHRRPFGNDLPPPPTAAALHRPQPPPPLLTVPRGRIMFQQMPTRPSSRAPLRVTPAIPSFAAA